MPIALYIRLKIPSVKMNICTISLMLIFLRPHRIVFRILNNTSIHVFYGIGETFRGGTLSLFEEHCQGAFKLCNKVTEEHVCLAPFTVMKVNLAAQVFSNNTACAGDTVRMRPFRLGSDTWKKATVMERLDDRSYQVMTNDGAQYRHNRVHLLKSLEPSGPSSGSPPEATPVAKRSSEVTPQEVPQNVSPPPIRRSQRDVKTPVYFKDYVMH